MLMSGRAFTSIFRRLRITRLPSNLKGVPIFDYAQADIVKLYRPSHLYLCADLDGNTSNRYLGAYDLWMEIRIEGNDCYCFRIKMFKKGHILLIIHHAKANLIFSHWSEKDQDIFLVAGS